MTQSDVEGREVRKVGGDLSPVWVTSFFTLLHLSSHTPSLPSVSATKCATKMSTKESVLRGKTPVQLLQEMCLKLNTSLPTYQFQGEESSPLGKNMKIFSHIVHAMNYEATGIGRSKQDSKHEAAWQLIRTVLNLPADESDDLAAAAEERNMHAAVELVTDRVNQLRDICIQRNFPLPEFELVRSYGPSHAPVFEYEVRIRDIVRRGSHSTKKGAKQIACQEMIKTLQELPVDECFLQVQSLDDALQEEEMTNDQLIRTYREYTQSDNKKKLGVQLADRHKYFLELPKERISEAYRIMLDQHETTREKCSLIPTALGLKFKITPNNILLPTKRGYNMSTFDLLNPDYDCFIFGQGEEFYSEVYQYFCRMLNFQQLGKHTSYGRRMLSVAFVTVKVHLEDPYTSRVQLKMTSL
uniref:DRBM domain-containing protein n=1 Tax=Anopheles atroparvus TaxID=41427 RepID=A0A182IT66_ANOAO